MSSVDVSGANKTRRSGPGHQKTRSVKPAIPLPHVQRQAAAAAAAAANTKGVSSPVSDANSTTRDTSVTEKVHHKEASLGAVESAENVGNKPAEIAASSSSPPSSLATGSGQTDALTSPDTSLGAQPHSTQAVNDAHHAHDDNAPPKQLDGKFRSTQAGQEGAPAEQDLASVPNPEGNPNPVLTSGGDFTQAYNLSQAPDRASPLPAHVPNEPQSNISNTTTTREFHPNLHTLATVNGRAPMHHQRLSSGAVHFGTFDDSSQSSPAPPHSGGIGAPPGMPAPNGRQSYAPHQGGSGFPPPMPPGLDVMGAGHFHGYDRQGIPYQSASSYQAHGSNFPPSTPYNFQDSQTPSSADDPSSYQRFTPTHARSGPGSFVEDSAGHNAQRGMYAEMGHTAMAPQHAHVPSMMGPSDDTAGLIQHLQQQFGTHDFADCSLELRNPDPRVTPIRIPAHRVVISRSPVLQSTLRKQAQEPPPHVVVVEAEDDWIRPDSFYMAFQRLYGLPLLQAPPPPHAMEAETMSAGSMAERFNFALSYAAAGRLLGWDPVIRRGCEIAAQYLTLDTVELAMVFALNQFEDKGSYETFKYGDGSRILLDAVLGFVASQLSPNFRLDTSVTESQGYARLPHDTPSPPKPVVDEASSPVIVRGNHQGHFSQASRSSNYHPHIQFGDLSLTNGAAPGSADTPRASHQTHTALTTVISRILINLPFGHLKMLLESGRGHGHDGFRFALVQDVVWEREGRRSRAVEAVNAGKVPKSGLIQSGLRTLEPTATTPWTVLGWEEQMSHSSTTDTPVLRRQWSPLKQSRNGPVSDYP